jgi:methionine aminotransferase
MSALARECNAINLSQGFPDYPCDPLLVELCHKYMREGHNQYAPMTGLPQLREQIAQKYALLYPATPLNPDTDITITAGGTQALYTAISAFVGQGDEVMVFEPCYDSYLPAIQVNGGVAVPIQLHAPDFRIDWEKVAQHISGRTRMIIINTPHNPTGTVLSADDMQQLSRLVDNTDILILSDEVYEHLIFDGQQHESILRYPQLWQRSLLVYSFGKSLHATGWKIGYCLAPAPLMREFRAVHQFLVFSVNTPLQYAIADYLAEPSHYTTLANFFQSKRDRFLQLLAPSRFTYQAASGSYFQLLDYSAISSLPDTEFAVQLTREIGVAAIPISVFYSNRQQQPVLRFCFAKQDETLAKAAELLCKI